MSKKPVLLCEKICKSLVINKEQRHILSDVSLTLPSATGAVITGVSGSGKSTLLNLIGGLDRPTTGTICIKGKWLHTLSEPELAILRGCEIGFVYQFHHLLDSFNVLENVAMPLLLRGISKKVAYARANLLLDQVELRHKLQEKTSALSGGERQRVAFARALVHQPSLILADEPTGSLDKENAARCFSLLQQLIHEHKTACLLITHDTTLATHWKLQYTMAGGYLTAQGVMDMSL